VFVFFKIQKQTSNDNFYVEYLARREICLI